MLTKMLFIFYYYYDKSYESFGKRMTVISGLMTYIVFQSLRRYSLVSLVPKIYLNHNHHKDYYELTFDYVQCQSLVGLHFLIVIPVIVFKIYSNPRNCSCLIYCKLNER